jgi:hypothetical protein
MLGDLGLGKSLETVSQLTMPGGTPAYVAPEQVMGDRLDQRADLYSLGAVAYAAFTGQAPHGVISLGAVMRIDAPPPSMSTIRDDIPPAIDAVVRRALEPDRDKRWPDLDSFLDALNEAHTTGKIPAGLVPAEELPVKVGPGGVDQATQLADANRPTIAPLAGLPAEEPATEAASAAVPVKRRSGRARWIAAVLAVVLAAGGGYGGYELVMSRPVTVKDNSERLSVKVPREWTEKSVNTADNSKPALLISTNTTDWQNQQNVDGVFVGIQGTSTLPANGTPPKNCTAGDKNSDNVGDRKAVTYTYNCGQSTVKERYLALSGSESVRIQVRDSDQAELQTVLDSVVVK